MRWLVSGSVFLYTDEADLIANFAMGQSATSNSNLRIVDMDGDNNLDIGLAVILADYLLGRLTSRAIV